MLLLQQFFFIWIESAYSNSVTNFSNLPIMGIYFNIFPLWMIKCSTSCRIYPINTPENTTRDKFPSKFFIKIFSIKRKNGIIIRGDFKIN